MANILLTCSGNKAYLVEILQESEHVRSVVAVDSDANATVRHYADDFYRVPEIDNGREEYVDAVLSFCRTANIDGIIPHNIDLLCLLKARDRAEKYDIRINGTSAEIAQRVLDKLALSDFLEDTDICYPDTAELDRVTLDDLPLIAKRRFGRCRSQPELVQNAERLEQLVENSTYELVAQRPVFGEEFSLDILADEKTGILSVVPKKKIEMKWGSAHKAQTVRRPDLIDCGERITKLTNHLGSIDVDVIVSRRTKKPFVLDINPRLGGGCGLPATHASCPLYTDMLALTLSGRSPSSIVNKYEAGVQVHRLFDFHTVNKNVDPKG
ncbi:carbamoyl-phosphate synthase large subunit [Salinibacter ruber]|uniref:ATP-grasp domain-containing protein n=1 Tax=Salinibacter ruber TaxID=146919 RepID=UPI002166C614|nr:ATP-grasp domain-containing protein [Salinibacter ruber]MCS3632507.1 carbamoyl-phosphate synthase large subunit [Salinibacter ruber]